MPPTKRLSTITVTLPKPPPDQLPEDPPYLGFAKRIKCPRCSGTGIVLDLPAKPSLAETQHFSQKWRRDFPTIAAATNDPKTFWIARDHAAELLNVSRTGLYTRYLRTGRLPYMVRTWPLGHGRLMRKIFVCRPVLNELVAALLLNHAKKAPHRERRLLGVVQTLDSISKRLNPLDFDSSGERVWRGNRTPRFWGSYRRT